MPKGSGTLWAFVRLFLIWKMILKMAIPSSQHISLPLVLAERNWDCDRGSDASLIIVSV